MKNAAASVCGWLEDYCTKCELVGLHECKGHQKWMVLWSLWGSGRGLPRPFCGASVSNSRITAETQCWTYESFHRALRERRVWSFTAYCHCPAAFLFSYIQLLVFDIPFTFYIEKYAYIYCWLLLVSWRHWKLDMKKKKPKMWLRNQVGKLWKCQVWKRIEKAISGRKRSMEHWRERSHSRRKQSGIMPAAVSSLTIPSNDLFWNCMTTKINWYSPFWIFHASIALLCNLSGTGRAHTRAQER